MVKSVEAKSSMAPVSGAPNAQYKVDKSKLTAVIKEQMNSKNITHKTADPINAAEHLADKDQLQMFYEASSPVGYNLMNVATWVLVVVSAVVKLAGGRIIDEKVEIDDKSTSDLSIDQLLDIKSRWR